SRRSCRFACGSWRWLLPVAVAAGELAGEVIGGAVDDGRGVVAHRTNGVARTRIARQRQESSPDSACQQGRAGDGGDVVWGHVVLQQVALTGPDFADGVTSLDRG